MNSSADSQTPPLPPSPETQAQSITLKVRNCGNIPAKKNFHFPRLDGGLMIDATIKTRMSRILNSLFTSLCDSQMTVDETLTAQRLHSLIQSLPCDDDWKHIPIITITAIKVPKGEEGADITIQQLKKLL